MNFLLADTFADSLTRLTTQEQKSVKTSVFDLQMDPSQRTYAEKSYNGPARITGSAGTGKTIVALHRAAKLLRENPGSRVLLTTFSPALASLLELKLGRLLGKNSELLSRIDVKALDEAQDLSVPQLRFLAALTAGKPDGLFLAGDIGQRIFQHPFSWKDLGLDVRGRSHALRVNYRTSHAIRKQADKLLPEEIRDLEGETESRKGTVSLFNGPDPEVKIHGSKDAEIDFVSDLILERIESGFLEGEIGIFVRSEAQLPRARAALKMAGVQWAELERTRAPEPNRVALSTMHLAKGLEFRAVIVMACDDEIIPLQERVESITDEADLEEVYITERHLLYVACTRARESLTISAAAPESEFLADLAR